MDLTVIEAYNSHREIGSQPFATACYAPYVSMLFDPLGNVRVCCQNFSLILGSVAKSRLRDIWEGPGYRALRGAMDRYDLDIGCEYCKWQILDGNYGNAFARHYDHIRVQDGEIQWPRLMEFNISNTCNLQCLMCNGEFSSSIRTKRERLAPIPKVYNDSFFEDLREFLPHLELAKCLGGEPFLAHEMFRVWDMMIEDGLSTRCHINTNGSYYNDQVERVLHNLPCTFQVSMDGFTKETFESVRVGADHETVIANFKRLHAYSQRPDGYISLTFCLMRQNWHELGDFLLFGDEWDCHVSITPVVFPSPCSLYTLPEKELEVVIRGLEKDEPRVLPRLGRNKGVWIEQMERLRNRLEHYSDDRPIFASLRLLEPFRGESVAVSTAWESELKSVQSEIQKWGTGEVATVRCDANDMILSLDSQDDTFLGITSDRCLGRRVDVMFSEFRVMYGGGTRITNVHEKPHSVDRILTYSGSGQKSVLVRSVTIPGPDGGSILIAGIKRPQASPEGNESLVSSES